MKFEYHEARCIREAISFANELPGKTRWLAGGTELFPKLKQRALTADCLINLKKIPELVGVGHNHSIIRIGSLTTLEELANSKSLGEAFSALFEAARGVASPNIRRAATIGGKPFSGSQLRILYPSQSLAPSRMSCGAGKYL
jgi:CO/xanthine dehydrogenase FAD-binding subunit